ncbi:hypothetical protein [Streptomyces lydicus]|uniref:hypothetical protein n=1 Tax=Streptomyces lydicus TaxID=47763 RepID=UPI0036FBDE0C
MVIGSLLVRPLRSTGPAPTKIVAPPRTPRTWGSPHRDRAPQQLAERPGEDRVSVGTSSGDKEISVPDDPSGTLRLDLRTGNGDITAGTPAS